MTDIRIDASNGDILVDGIAITPATTPAELPDDFMLGVASDVMVGRDTVPVRFAHATVTDGGQEIGIDLRFERDVLVSVFFRLNTSDDADAAGWYESVGKREEAHLRWLRDKLGARQGAYTRYPWGVVGVAPDKSADVYVFLHNRHNTWAR